MRAAIYARVSSAAQRDAHTIESQLRVLPKFVADRGWILAGTYIDDGKSARSGKLDARDGFRRLVTDASAKMFDVVVVVDVDRLTRADDLTERGAVLGAIQRAGVKIAVSTSGQVLDMATTSGDLMGTLYAFFAAEENRKRRERTVQGKLTAISRGAKPSGPTPFGYRYDKANGWSIDELAAEIVRGMYERVARGESCERVAIWLTETGVKRPRAPMWIRERVWAVVTARTYLGEWKADKRRGLVVKVPQIVSDELWHRAQETLMAQGRRGLRRTKHVYLLEELALCGVCGTRICISSGIRDRAPSKYICGHRRRPERGGLRCDLRLHKTAELDELIWERVRDAILSPGMVELGLRRLAERTGGDRECWESDLGEAQARLGRLERAEAAMLARFRTGAISETAMDSELKAIGRERSMLRHQVETAERAMRSGQREFKRVVDIQEGLAGLRSVVAQLSSPVDRRRIVKGLVPVGGAVVESDGVTLDVLAPQSSTRATHVDAVPARPIVARLRIAS